MKKSLCFVAICFLFLQTKSNAQEQPSVFEKLTNSIKEYKPDTTTPPDDKLTKKIIQLRNLKGGFNINEAFNFKIGEEMQKGETPKAELEKLKAYFTTGDGKKRLDNAVIWVYRNEFSYKEVKKMVRFYKTPAGQKLSDSFAIIMLRSLVAAEMIKEAAAAGTKKPM
jgi:uncharacterized protein